MRAAVLVVLAACGGPAVSATTTALTSSPTEPAPADVADHVHIPPAHADDPNKLYVEVTSDSNHAGVLRQSVTSGLSMLRDIVPVDDGGDVELHAEVVGLAPDGATCQVKIFVLRLPQHDLLAIADGGARATGAGAADSCLSATGSAIVRDKLPLVFARQLQAKK